MRRRRGRRHKVGTYGSGAGDCGGCARAARGQAQGLPLRGRRGDCKGRVGGDARAGTRPAPTGAVWGLRWPCGSRRQGRHKACPYRSGVGIAVAVWVAAPGQAQGLPLQERCGDCGGRVGGDARAGTRPAPTGVVWGLRRPCGWRREGRHKACPYGSGVGIAEAVRVGSAIGAYFRILSCFRLLAFLKMYDWGRIFTAP